MSYDPELFAAVHAGNPGDVVHYVALCRGAASVLELGAGEGRVLRGLAAAGITDSLGIEIDERLRALAGSRAPRVEIRAGDMRALDLDRRFDRILAPFNALYCLADEAELARTFEGVRAHLAPNGRFAFDVWNADAFHEDEDDGEDEDDPDLVTEVTVGGVRHQVYETTRFDRSQRTVIATYHHVPEGGGPTVTGEVRHRYFTTAELDAALTAAGLALVSRKGGFGDEPFDRDAELTVVVAQPSP